jgi:hypothetical protein
VSRCSLQIRSLTLTLRDDDLSAGNGIHLEAAAGQQGHADQGLTSNGERRDRARATVP